MKLKVLVLILPLVFFFLPATSLATGRQLAQRLEIDNPIGKTYQNGMSSSDIYKIFGQAGRYLLETTGALSFAAFIFGGLLYLTSAGSDRVKMGTETLKWATIGVVLSLVAYVALNFLISVLTS